jgi:hypothetical protein
MNGRCFLYSVPRITYSDHTNDINHQQMHKGVFFIKCKTLLHVSTLLGHLQGELFVTVTLRLHFTVERECAVDCVLCTGGVNCPRSSPAGRDRREFTPRACRPGPQTIHASSTETTAHSHSTVKCNLSVTVTKSSP